MIVTRDVGPWLYALIVGSFLFSLLMISTVLDKFAKPSGISAPPIYSSQHQDKAVRGKESDGRRVDTQYSRRFRSNQHQKIWHPDKEILHSSNDDLIVSSIRRERERVFSDMEDFVFSDGLELSDHLAMYGGQPVRAMVATTWRSGSTFLGDIMDSHPATYYHYEPLLHFDIRQARHGYLAKEGIRTLKDLMNCDYSNLSNYIQYGKSHPWLFQHNTRLWKYCTEQGPNYQHSFCWKPKFLNRFCSLFPFQSIKTVRLRLNLTREFFKDTKFQLKIVLLVRDPRGTIQSRKHRDWCPGNPDCDDPSKLCSDLTDDYYALQELMADFPDRYRVVRYEDFSMDPYNSSRDLFNFFGYTMHPQVKAFLDSHTKTNIGGVSSTFRDSKTAPFKWREKLTRQEVYTIQDSCVKAMQLWGYKPLTDSETLSELEPVLSLQQFRMPTESTNGSRSH